MGFREYMAGVLIGSVITMITSYATNKPEPMKPIAIEMVDINKDGLDDTILRYDDERSIICYSNRLRNIECELYTKN